jgi:3-oxoadipate enol-lactonase
MAWLTRDGVRLYAERRGDGPPLLIISGTGSSLARRPNSFDLPFASGFDAACYDHRGLGSSDQPGPTDAWSMADYADDAAAVLDWAQWDSAAVIGISFGGMVAQELLIRHPGRVSRAVLACTSSGGDGGASFPLHEHATLPAAERTAASLPVIDTRWADPDFHDPLREMIGTAMRALPPPTAGDLVQLDARRHHDTWSRLPQVDVPVFACTGEFDGIAPPANSEAIAAQVQHGRVRIFGGGHGFLYQDPASAIAIRDFLLEAQA